MKNNISIQKLSDPDLLSRTKFWAEEERKATAQLIEHLREIERRKLYSDLHYGSLFKYCIKHLKLSEGAAQRRINVLRLTQDLPETKAKIESGELSLSVAARMQSFFQKETLSPEVKKEIAREVQGKTFFEAERVLLRHSSEPERHRPERVQPVSPTHSRIEFTASDEELQLFEKTRGLLAHSAPSATWNELFVAMAKKIIEKYDPAYKSRRDASPMRKTEKRPPTASIQREVLQESGSKCANCGSQYALQIDHCEDWALGGVTAPKNLQALCKNCNQRKAIRSFGLRKIESEIQAGKQDRA